MHTGSSITVSDVLSIKFPHFKDNGIILFHFTFALGSILALSRCKHSHWYFFLLPVL